MAEPVLDASDVGLVLEGVGGGGGPEGVDDALHGDGGEGGVLPDEFVDAVAREWPAGPAGLRRLEQGCFPVAAVPGELARIGATLNQIARWDNTFKANTEALEVIAHLVAIERALDALTVEGDRER